MAVSSTTGGLKTGVCLSTDRPDNPFNGQVIYETDTNRTLVWDNSAWVVIANASSTGFPTSLDTNTVDSIAALQAKVGINSSAVTSSHDYKIAQLEAEPSANEIAIFNETQSSGTEGGTATSGSWAKRTLNTTVVNNIAGCSIATSVVTLPEGTYQIYAQTPAYAVNIFQSRLYDNTNTTTLLVGSGSHSNPTYSNQSDSFINGTIVLGGSTNIQLEMRVATTKTTAGLGRGGSFGENTVFSTLIIRRIA